AASSRRAPATAACRPSRRRSARASGCRSCELSFQEDVVDQADGADADRGGENLGVAEVEHLDVVRLEAVERGARRSDGIRVADGGAERARELERPFSLLFREPP